MKFDQEKKLKEFAKEYARLKWLVTEPELDKVILREAAQGDFSTERIDKYEWSIFSKLGAERMYPSIFTAEFLCPCKYGVLTVH